MELNKDIRDVLVELAMITKENNYTNSQILIRSTYDAFRIQNIVEKLSIHIVSNTEGKLFCSMAGKGVCPYEKRRW